MTVLPIFLWRQLRLVFYYFNMPFYLPYSVILFEIRMSACFIYLFIMWKSHEVRTKQNLESISLLSALLVEKHDLYQKEKKNRKTNYSALGRVIQIIHLACHVKNVSLIIYLVLNLGLIQFFPVWLQEYPIAYGLLVLFVTVPAWCSSCYSLLSVPSPFLLSYFLHQKASSPLCLFPDLPLC